jgi:hypothetical protein
MCGHFEALTKVSQVGRHVGSPRILTLGLGSVEVLNGTRALTLLRGCGCKPG